MGGWAKRVDRSASQVRATYKNGFTVNVDVELVPKGLGSSEIYTRSNKAVSKLNILRNGLDLLLARGREMEASGMAGFLVAIKAFYSPCLIMFLQLFV